jgi:exopolyphosphatase/pppGpp-phosphohydrolase
LVADSEVDLALEKLKITLERFRRKAAKMGAHRIRVIGTEAIRLLAERSLLSRELE